MEYILYFLFFLLGVTFAKAFGFVMNVGYSIRMLKLCEIAILHMLISIVEDVAFAREIKYHAARETGVGSRALQNIRLIDDETTKNFILSGGDGVISVTANVAPEKMSKMCVSALEGNVEEAGKIDKTLVGLHKALFLESNPIPVKWVLNKLGLIEPGIRLPMTWLSEDFEDDLFNAMKQADIV